MDAFFITLSTPPEIIVSPAVAYKQLLDPFLVWFRQFEAGITWKIDLNQEGRVHYHCVTLVDVSFDLIRDVWMHILKNAGWYLPPLFVGVDIKKAKM